MFTDFFLEEKRKFTQKFRKRTQNNTVESNSTNQNWGNQNRITWPDLLAEQRGSNLAELVF